MKRNNLQGQVVRLETEKLHLENEIERLNNIINELEKYLVERIECNQGGELQDYLENTYSMVYSVLQELKGSDKE